MLDSQGDEDEPVYTFALGGEEKIEVTALDHILWSKHQHHQQTNVGVAEEEQSDV